MINPMVANTSHSQYAFEVSALFYKQTSRLSSTDPKNIDLVSGGDRGPVDDRTRPLERPETASGISFNGRGIPSLFWDPETSSWRDVEVAERRSEAERPA